MVFSYKNFRGDTYYLHATQTKKGNPRYHFAKKIDESTSEDQLPKGYEVYEEPNGKVYARKKTKAMLNPAEISIISDGMKKYSEVSDFKLDIKKNIVSIYTNESTEEESLIPLSLKHKYYEAKMRFILIDEEARTFVVERFCYLGSVDDWIDLDCSDDLSELVKEYVQHIGKESFYELM